MNLVADKHYDVKRYNGGFRHEQVQKLSCRFCEFSVDVVALHRQGDKSGASRYCRARAKIVKHIHAEHRQAVTL